MESATLNGATYTFDYNAQGLRTTKKVGSSVLYYTYDSSGRLVSEQTSTDVMLYIYDVNGSPVGMQYRTNSYAEGVWDVYWFEKNLHGDIVAVYSKNGTKLATYSYDAFGNCTETYMNTGSSTAIVRRNPFRYRGYYYDLHLRLYYLESRYYDSVIGRFISPDSVVSNVGGDLRGYNLYAYCFNDPVNMTDPEGEFPWLILAAALFTPVGGTALQIVASTVSYAGMAVASIFDEDVRNDMDSIEWNPFNSDESATLDSDKVSFYKGVPVFRTAADGRSGSFGAIFLTKGSGADTLRHERGHNAQLMMMGIANYGLMIGLPSWLELSNRSYYERPWEITADVFGGVTGRTHSQSDINRGYCYLGVSSLFGAVGYLFLFGEY